MSFYSKNSTNVRIVAGWTSLVRSAPGRLAPLAPRLAARWAAARFFTPPSPRSSPAVDQALASARPFSVSLGTRRVAAWSWGEGPAVYLVHGWAGRGAQLRAFVPPLLEAGYKVVTFDAPGHGITPGRQTNLIELADILEVLVHLEGRAQAIIAHSLGAAATALALRRGLQADRAVFLGPLAHPGRYFQKYLEHSGIPVEARGWITGQVERDVGFRWSELDVPAMGEHVQIPTLVFHDRGDAEIPWSEGRAIAAAWPGAELVTTEGLGHRRILKDAGVVTRSISFVTAPGALPVDELRNVCSRPGCGRRVGSDLAGSLGLCDDCLIALELYDRGARQDRLAYG